MVANIEHLLQKTNVLKLASDPIYLLKLVNLEEKNPLQHKEEENRWELLIK